MVKFSYSNLHRSQRRGMNKLSVELRWEDDNGKMLIRSIFEIVTNLYPNSSQINPPPQHYGLPNEEQAKALIREVLEHVKEVDNGTLG